jgi:predicted ester cyclase
VLRSLRGAFNDRSYEVKDAFGDGDRILIRLITRGTHTGEFMGKPATGRPFEMEAIHL